jgi:dipeptidyl aminopeptidase/acylaminoacyl peptidase
MRKLVIIPFLALAATTWIAASQPQATKSAPQGMLTVDSIMRGPKLVGNPPTGIRFSKDSSHIIFSWQKAGDERAATYSVGRDGTGLKQLSADDVRALEPTRTGRLDRARKRLLTLDNGDVVIYDAASGAKVRQVTRTTAPESSPRWARNDTAVTFTRDGNLFIMSLDPKDEATAFAQLTDINVAADTPPAAAAAAAGRGATGGRGAAGAAGGRGAGTGAAGMTDAQRLLAEQERQLMEYLKNQQGGRGGGGGAQAGGAGRGGAAGANTAVPVTIARLTLSPRQNVLDLQLSADEKYVWVSVNERPDGTPRGQDVPNYVTSSSYPEMIPGRSNVGDLQGRRLLAAMETGANHTVWADASAFAGVERKAKPADPDEPRAVNWTALDTSEDGAYAIVAIRSLDNKDRWFATIDPATGKASVIDWLHDDAWIREQNVGAAAGLGGGTGVAWLPDNKRFLFLSEKDGYLHLHSVDMSASRPVATALTSGKWEVTDARLSTDRKTVFLTTNEVHPGERQFYTMSVDGGSRTRVTTLTGSNDATISPDEKSLAILYSYSTKPPELYAMPLTAGATATQITVSPSEEWRTFKWIDPKVITYKTRDGQAVYARLYTPEMIGAKRDPKKPAVIFVHGAGYLQNAHKYWSTYYREYMFNNLLASRGYVVLDPDYRASSGYGRDWRTAIYRHMGGKDLEDVVDGAKFLVDTEKVDPKRIGLYGGSYGGFITLMALFTTPDVFASGAALRPVTDWAHYNHGYTSNILNIPQTDPEAYKKSSPIFFADGLKGRLLICHGMVDTNVFFQDSVRLVQRLIELRKENWEIAPFPVENHGFTEETSWADEYKRILKLFEESLRQ